MLSSHYRFILTNPLSSFLNAYYFQEAVSSTFGGFFWTQVQDLIFLLVKPHLN